MCDSTTHDFGSVPRGAKADYLFVVQNKYKEDVHLAGVRASCGCVTPTIEKDTLKTWEKGGVLVTFNTKSFLGNRSATITLTIDKPYFAEIQFQITGHIRSDVVLTPGNVAFGTVDQGQPQARKVDIQYSGGDPTWRITAIKSPAAFLTAEAVEVKRNGGTVQYEMTVNLDNKTPTGHLKESLIIETSDRTSSQFPVEVEGRITTELSVNPASPFFGQLPVGGERTVMVLVRAKRPFKILSMECADKNLSFVLPTEANAIHKIPLTYKAAEGAAGDVRCKLIIKTDLGNQTAEVNGFATLTGKAPDEPAPGPPQAPAQPNTAQPNPAQPNPAPQTP
jgi:hypothetical protein